MSQSRSDQTITHTCSHAVSLPPPPLRASLTGRGRLAPQLTDRGGLDRSAKGSEAAEAAESELMEHVSATSSTEVVDGGDLATR